MGRCFLKYCSIYLLLKENTEKFNTGNKLTICQVISNFKKSIATLQYRYMYHPDIKEQWSHLFWKFALYYQNVQFLFCHFWHSPMTFLWLSSFFINHFLLLLTACFSERNWNPCHPQVESDSTKETCYCSKVL